MDEHLRGVIYTIWPTGRGSVLCMILWHVATEPVVALGQTLREVTWLLLSETRSEVVETRACNRGHATTVQGGVASKRARRIPARSVNKQAYLRIN